MAIARKLSQNEPSSPRQMMDEKKIEALIEKGGSSTQAVKKTQAQAQDDDLKPVLIRIFQSQLNEIEETISKLPKRQKLSRHAWIIQAIEEKIDRDNGKRKWVNPTSINPSWKI